MKSLTLAGLIIFPGLVVALRWDERRVDPVIEGKRMSVWAQELVCERYARNQYGIKAGYMHIFKMDRDASICALMKASGNHRSKTLLLWLRFTRLLPERLGSNLRPKPIYALNRWAGVLALSNLAREKADERIPGFFLECMQDSNMAVRKIAAYEAGPWLDPEHPATAVKILRLGLADRSAEVRRDACRRVAASGGKTDRYGVALRELLPQLREMNVEVTPDGQRALAAIAN